MTTAGQPQETALHEPYVQAVVRELNKLDVRGTDLRVWEDEGLRCAEMRVEQDDPLYTNWEEAEWVRLRWDERAGWSWSVKYPDDARPRAAVYFGISQVPPPNVVAAWMHSSLEVPTSVFRETEALPPVQDLEVVLRTYAATAQ